MKDAVIYLGFRIKNGVTYESDFVQGLHPEDRNWVTKLIDDLFTLQDSNGDYDVEYRTVGVDDKKIRWVRAKGKVFYDGGHKPIRFIGSVLDISTNKNYQQELQIINDELARSNEEQRIANVQLHSLQEALQQSNINLIASNEKLEQAIATGMMGTWSVNPADMSIYMSDYVKTLLGLPVNGNPSLELIMQAIDSEFHQKVTDVLSDAISNGKDSDTEYTITNLITGEHKWVRATGKVIKDAWGQVTEYSGLFMDITERKLDELRKNDFIGMVSHELKTPLTSLLPLIQVADMKLKNNPEKFLSEAMGRAMVQVKRMGAMIDGFLNVSRLEAGKISIIKQDFSIDELLKEVIHEFELTISKHIIKISDRSKVIINADKNKIGSVITNLISNAIKYSPKGGDIIVKCTVKGNAVEIGVKDEGIGIKATDKKKLFERYYRVEDIQSKHISGFGIGLYLSAEIVHRHGGEIWVESQIGIGSEFFFRLPINGRTLNI
jgi:two-component system sensor histidine kinase VicK